MPWKLSRKELCISASTPLSSLGHLILGATQRFSALVPSSVPTQFLNSSLPLLRPHPSLFWNPLSDGFHFLERQCSPVLGTLTSILSNPPGGCHSVHSLTSYCLSVDVTLLRKTPRCLRTDWAALLGAPNSFVLSLPESLPHSSGTICPLICSMNSSKAGSLCPLGWLPAHGDKCGPAVVTHEAPAPHLPLQLSHNHFACSLHPSNLFEDSTLLFLAQGLGLGPSFPSVHFKDIDFTWRQGC